MNRIRYVMNNGSDALSIIAEFAEWIDPTAVQLEILSLDEEQ